MKVLLVHQNFPGQFVHLAPALVQRGHQVRVLTDARNTAKIDLPNLRYTFAPPEVDPAATRLGRNYTTHSDRAVTVARAARAMRERDGYVPDVIYGHSGWGETLYLKEVWPESRLIVYAEFYYSGTGADVGFDPEFNPPAFDQRMIAQARAAHLGQAILHADQAVSPTRWQADRHPSVLRAGIQVLHDGIDTDRVRPNADASLALPDGRILRAGDEVLTFVSRNLEPYRGYHVLMRALPEVMRARPEAQVVLIGGDEQSYGAAPKSGGNWKQVFLKEVEGQLDLSRLHFLGKVSYPSFLSVLQISRVHAYLTYPFVLSWSMLEAMAAGTLVVGSRTPPVEEVIEDGQNGLLVDFFDTGGWSRTLVQALEDPARFDPLRRAGRQTVIDRYDLRQHCLPRQIALIEG